MERTVIATLLQKILLIPMVALWAFHLYQRRFMDAAVHKRIATLSLTVVIIMIWGAAWVFSKFNINDLYLVPGAIVAAAAVLWQRKLVLPYRLHCVQCGKRLSVTRMLSFDSNKCSACDPVAAEGETR